jgi:hypothetical protein
VIRRAGIEWGLVAVAAALFVVGLIIGLTAWQLMLASVLVGVAAIAVGGFSFFGGRRRR